jgi:hypothetical protein
MEQAVENGRVDQIPFKGKNLLDIHAANPAAG